MAVTLPSAATADRLSFPDQALIAGATGLTIALTIRPSGGISTDAYLVSQWSGSVPAQAFVMAITDNDELAIAVNDNNGGAQYMTVKTTDSLNITAGTVYRICASIRLQAGGGLRGRIMVNGVQRKVGDWFGQSAFCFAIEDSSSPIDIGFGSVQSQKGVNGDYSEFALWLDEINDTAAYSYTMGISPRFLQRAHGPGGSATTPVLYAPLLNTSRLQEVWRNTTITNTNGVNAQTHPQMFNLRSGIVRGIAAPVVTPPVARVYIPRPLLTSGVA